MQTTHQKLLDWTPQDAAGFGRKAVVARHRLQEMELFSDAALVRVLDTHPRDQLQAFTMGTDTTNIQQWQPVDIAGVPGTDLLAAIRRGRLWFHLFKMQSLYPEYGRLQEDLFSELSHLCPTLEAFNKSSTLIISSPTALVYYHADAQFNLLWHIRGSKRVWSYPPNDRELLDQEMMEDIFASYADEEVPYKPEFDAKAAVFDLGPGDVVSWALNAPHRVTNLEDINVSLSTVYETEDSYRRKLVYSANRFFRRSYSLPTRSTKETGICSYFKRSAFRALQKAGMVGSPHRRAYVTRLQIDSTAPDGIRRTEGGPVLTEFSKGEFTLKTNAVGEIAAVPIEKI